MRIVLIGYGKMGKEIERIAIDRGHQIVSKIDIENPDDLISLKIMPPIKNPLITKKTSTPMKPPLKKNPAWYTTTKPTAKPLRP